MKEIDDLIGKYIKFSNIGGQIAHTFNKGPGIKLGAVYEVLRRTYMDHNDSPYYKYIYRIVNINDIGDYGDVWLKKRYITYYEIINIDPYNYYNKIINFDNLIID